MTKYRPLRSVEKLRESPERTYLDSLHIDLRCELEEVFHARLGDLFFALEELMYDQLRDELREEEV